MSWSSSLLFVIQYAIYRGHKFRRSLQDVKILAIDTTAFPLGQFARDLWLFRKCQSTNDGNPAMQRLVDLRNSCAYDSGEYLSQGTLNHKGRSCMMSLSDLIDAGLYELYPDFQDDDGARKWSSRVKELREEWGDEDCTYSDDVELAFDIANECFPNFESLDMALMLLAFQNRNVTMNGMSVLLIGNCNQDLRTLINAFQRRITDPNMSRSMVQSRYDGTSERSRSLETSGMSVKIVRW